MVIGDLFSAKAEELSLFGPVCRQPRRQAHQCLGGELRTFSAIDDGHGDVGRQPRKTQEGIEVGSGYLFFASDVMHGQLGALAQAGMDMVRAGKDSEQAGISRRLVIGILDQHTHFATRALQARRNCQRQHIAGSIRQSVMRHLEIERPGEQLGQPGSMIGFPRGRAGP